MQNVVKNCAQEDLMAKKKKKRDYEYLKGTVKGDQYSRYIQIYPLNDEGFFDRDAATLNRFGN